MLKAFKINVENRKVEEITISSSNDISNHIGNGCGLITAPIILDNEDTIYVDDEGMYNDYGGGFMMEDWAYPLVGNGVLLGSNEEGDSVDVKTTKEELEKMIKWVSQGMIEKWIDSAL